MKDIAEDFTRLRGQNPPELKAPGDNRSPATPPAPTPWDAATRDQAPLHGEGRRGARRPQGRAVRPSPRPAPALPACHPPPPPRARPAPRHPARPPDAVPGRTRPPPAAHPRPSPGRRDTHSPPRPPPAPRRKYVAPLPGHPAHFRPAALAPHVGPASDATVPLQKAVGSRPLPGRSQVTIARSSPDKSLPERP